MRAKYLTAIEDWHEAAGWERAGPKWERVVAVEEERRRLAEAAYPADRNELLSRLDAADPDAVEAAVTWLEVDPFTWRTGYFKQKLICRLCGAPLSPEQLERLRYLVLRLTTRGPRQEFRDTVRLARRLDSPEFRIRLRVLAERPEAHIAYAAGRVLKACETKGTHGT
jgi:hypothetical protein